MRRFTEPLRALDLDDDCAQVHHADADDLGDHATPLLRAGP
jgi:hypothetical protein